MRLNWRIPYSPGLWCMHLYTKPPYFSKRKFGYVYRCTLPVSYSAACTYIRSSMKIFLVACTIKWNHFRLLNGYFWQKVLKNHKFWPLWTSNYLPFSKLCIRAPPAMVENFWISIGACTYIRNRPNFLKPKKVNFGLTFGACTIASVSYTSACTTMRGNAVLT